MISKEWLEGFYSNVNDRNPHGLPGVSGPAGITEEWEQWRLGHLALWGTLETDIAKILYHNEGGMPDEDYHMAFLEERPPWNTISQHVQEEYEWQAFAVIRMLNRHGLLNIEELRQTILRGDENGKD